ncbi:MAG: PepSY domain-containing protein [Pseudomonadales bacterium]|jgi:uncharacterized iron-regulated membrane protein|nr:PepSY domain-containing protein [Pseudomonadales bacterium]
MNAWQRWVRAPQTLLLRRLLFQLHLWLGVGCSLYVLVISLSGSALLLRSPFYQWFEPKYVAPAPDAVALTGEELQARMREVYTGYTVGFTIEGFERNLATYVVLNQNGDYTPHYFDQYTGRDIGRANPWPIQTVQWLSDLHADLTFGRLGRKINGYGGLLFVVMSLSGLVLWWQGRARWREGFYPQRHSPRSWWWQLHTLFGFWGLLLMLAWGVSGFQLGLPQYLDTLLRWLSPESRGPAPGSALLRFFREVHFARPGSSTWARWAWIVASLLPTLLLLSGVVLWYKRVVRGRWWRRA